MEGEGEGGEVLQRLLVATSLSRLKTSIMQKCQCYSHYNMCSQMQKFEHKVLRKLFLLLFSTIDTIIFVNGYLLRQLLNENYMFII